MLLDYFELSLMLTSSVLPLLSLTPFIPFLMSCFPFVIVPNVTVLFQSPGDQQIQPYHSHVLPASREDPEGEAGEGGPDPLLQPQQHQ